MKSRAAKDGKARPGAAYDTVVQRAEITTVMLLSSSHTFHLERLGNENQPLMLWLDPPQFFGRYEAESKQLACGVRFQLYVAPPEERPAPDPDHDHAKSTCAVEVQAEYYLVYKLPDAVACEPQIASLFASRNAVFNAWPFFRELAHSLVARTALPPLVLPLFRMPPEPQQGTF